MSIPRVGVWFDCYQTLIYKKNLVKIIQRFAFSTLAARLSFRAVEQALETIYQRRKFEHPRFRNPTERRRYFVVYNKELFNLLGWPLSTYAAEQLHQALRFAPYAAYADVAPTLRWLKKKNNIFIGALANWTASLPVILRQLKLTDYFDVVLTSHSLGVAKPDPEFFRQALRAVPRHQFQKNYYIGDDYDLDVEPARLAGWSPLLLDRVGRYPPRIVVPRILTLRRLTKFF